MIQVTCAIIIFNNKILCAQRSENMKHPLKWEFPGGKVEIGEDLEACLAREIHEELNIIVQVEKAITPSSHDYGNGIEIILYPFICVIISGNILPKEHKELQWLPLEGLKDLDWVAADLPIVEEVMNTLSNPKF
jgi:8-oxo-dGTP diphosphatase